MYGRWTTRWTGARAVVWIGTRGGWGGLIEVGRDEIVESVDVSECIVAVDDDDDDDDDEGVRTVSTWVTVFSGTVAFTGGCVGSRTLVVTVLVVIVGCGCESVGTVVIAGVW